MNESKSDPRYLMGRSDEETERLIQQSQLYETVTRRFFTDAGIGRGMRVLDVGSGAGDVAMAAAELVGAEGEVVGWMSMRQFSRQPEHGCKNRATQIFNLWRETPRTMDIEGDFDAVVGRLVLMYMSDPADALRQLTARLRPGGIAAFQEGFFTLYRSLTRPDTPLVNKLIDWALAVFERSGVHLDMGADLHRTFVDADLPAPALNLIAPAGGAETWVGYQYIAESIRSFVPLMEEFGIATAEEVDIETLAERLRAEVVAAKRPMILPPHITAWARLEI